MSQENTTEDLSEQVKEASTDDLETKNGDEQTDGQSLAIGLETNTVELTDPAILEMREEQRYSYSREELLKLRNVPLSRQKPVLLNYAQNISREEGGWSYDRKRSETPAENNARTLDPSDNGKQKRQGDPRERLRKDMFKIVLSPQRESFNHGCCVPGRDAARDNRSHSPIGKPEPTHIGHPNAARRIGSGRIMREAWDYQEKTEVDFSFRRERRDTDERYERRSFGRDFDMNRDKDKERERHIGRGNSRYNDRRRMDNREEEPEWFSGGPVSQTDTIELRGFDESEKLVKKKQPPAQKKRTNLFKERAITKNAETQPGGENSEEAAPGKQPVDKGRSTPDGQGNKAERKPPQSPKPDLGAGGDTGSFAKARGEEKGTTGVVEQSSDNLDYFLSGSIPKLLANGVGGEGDATTSESRFTQFFKRESSQKQRSDSPSLPDDHVIRNLLKDITEPSVSIPGDSNLYFAPISPAANTGSPMGAHGAQSKPFNELMEMIQRKKQQQMPMQGDGPLKPMDIPGKVLRVEEVEGSIRQGGGDAGQKVVPPKSGEDIAAFRKLLSQITANNGTAPQKTPMTIMEMLSHSQQLDEVRNMTSVSHLLNSASPNPAQMQDLQYKLQQVHNQAQQQRQLDMLSKMMNARQQQQPTISPVPDMGIAQARELLNRPEAQAILQGLQRGDITPQHLHQQLAANTAMQARHRELLYTILKTQGGGGVGPSPRVLSPVPPSQHPMFQQQQQQLRVSPLPPNAMHQRIPSPRELQVHTQNILQRALIKKKLEEQQENFRKKQEMQQRGQSPSGGIPAVKSVASPTPLAFTPTSVLRKMTADKEEGNKEGGYKTADGLGKTSQGRPVIGIRPQAQQPQNQMQQQWMAQYSMKQPGRPILKSNPNFQQQPSQMQNQAEQHFYQQRMYNQQQQQRKSMPQQHYPSNSNVQSASNSNQYQSHSQYNPSNQFPQLTQQQLRAQHQQHVRAVQQNQGGYVQQGNQQPSWQQLINTQPQNYEDRSSTLGRGGLGNEGGDLSPTSNQLARWFSPNLLKKARAGELPNMPTASLSQHALSLEEIERQTAAPVHN